MKLLIIDTETTGIDPKADHVIEIAAALYDDDHKLVLWQMATLVHGATANPAESINHIPISALDATKAFHDPFEEVGFYMQMADYLVAHNAAFDRGMIGDRLPTDKPWICSKSQLKFPNSSMGGRLTHQAVDNGIIVQGAHRAMADVMLLVELCKLTPDLPAQIARALSPQIVLEAIVSYDKRHLAKDAGFSWNGVAKRWEKSFPASEAPPVLPFEVRQVPQS